MKCDSKNLFLVYVNCMTYNHAPYIKDALDGFTIQQTTFPFVCIIVDDCSQDGTGEVIRQYLKDFFEIEDEDISEKEDTDDYSMLYACHKHNKNCYFAVYFLKYNHFGKKEKRPYFSKWTNGTRYMAFCEGDDYWTDPHKLEMQVNFLEAIPEYGMCFTDFNMRYGNSYRYRLNLFTNEPQTFRTDYTLEQWILSKRYVAPMTWVVRSVLWDSAPRLQTPDGTYVLFAYFLKVSKTYCFKNQTTAVYRVLRKSASHSEIIQDIYEKRILGLYKVQLSLINLFYEGDKRLQMEHITNRNFFKSGLRWIIATEDREMLEKAFLFYKKEKKWGQALWIRFCSFTIVMQIWKQMFRPLLLLRRYSKKRAIFKKTIIDKQRMV